MHDGNYPTPIDDEGLARYINHEIELSGIESFVLMRSPDGIYRLDNPPGSPEESMELQGGEVLQVIEGGKLRKFRYEPACVAEDSDGLNEVILYDLLRLGKTVKTELQWDGRTRLFDVGYIPRVGFVVHHRKDSFKPLLDSSMVFAYGKRYRKCYRVAYENRGLVPWMEPEESEPENGTGSPDILDEEDLMTLMLEGVAVAIDSMKGKISFDFRKNNFCILGSSGSRYNLYDGAEITICEGRSRRNRTTYRCLLSSGSEEPLEAVCLR